MAPSGVGVGIKLALCLIIVMTIIVPVAHAQSFSVTTNKDVYSKGDRVIVAGTLSDSNGDDIIVQIKKDDRQCALQVIKGGSGESFVSRPLSVGNCGSGEYIVTAYHSGAAVQSKFIVASTREDASSDNFRLRIMKNFILQAQEKATEKVKDVINSGSQLPQQAAEPYQSGIIETSLAIQALESGDAASALEHQTAAFAHFRDTIDALAAERIGTLTQVQPERVVASEQPDKLAVLQNLYRRLVDLAKKNDVQDDFSGIANLLSQA
jgi:hypothetical protein